MSTVGVIWRLFEDYNFSSREVAAHFPEAVERPIDVQRIVVCEVLRASAFTHAVGIDEVEVEGEEVFSDGRVQRSSSKEEELTLIQPQSFFDVIEDKYFSQFELDARVFLSTLLVSAIRTEGLSPSGDLGLQPAVGPGYVHHFVVNLFPDSGY